MRKKVLALLLCSFCVVSGIAMTDCADALQKNQAESRVESKKALEESSYQLSANISNTGKECKVSILISGNEPQLDSLQFKIRYDSEVMELTEITDYKRIGANSVFSSKKTDNPFTCMWYVGYGEKPEPANGTLIDFLFCAKKGKSISNSVFLIEGIKGFYNTVQNIDGKEQATETKVQLENMTYEVVPLLYGDIDNNGKVDFADVLCLKRHVAKWSGYENINTELANLNHDDSIDEKDILILERYVAGWENYETSSE